MKLYFYNYQNIEFELFIVSGSDKNVFVIGYIVVTNAIVT